MLKFLFEKIILKNFYKIQLTSLEKQTLEVSMKSKYLKVGRNSILFGLLMLPSILFIDTDIIVSVLIPIVMVSGTAWFAISVATVKKKLENFAIELTGNLFESFVTSLIILLLIALFALNKHLLTFNLDNIEFIRNISGIIGTIIIARIIWLMFIGSTKYDINDIMLTGQNEVAERFFKQSLSFLHQASNQLKDGKNLEIANYYFGKAFEEIFLFVQSHTNDQTKTIETSIELSIKLQSDTKISKRESDLMGVELVENFLQYCSIEKDNIENSINVIKREKNIIKSVSDESQIMVDTRFSTIFTEISKLIEEHGEALFKSSSHYNSA